MNVKIQQVAERIRELREILGFTQEQIANKINVALDTYIAYENGAKDISISELYAVALEFNVDATVLLTGDAPRMNQYTIIRNGKGVEIERYSGYKFNSLASNFAGREMDPMIVTIEPRENQSLVSHNGQEFNFILSGTVLITIGKHEFELNSGDSIYFDPRIPHSQNAIGDVATFLTVINEK